MIDRWLKRDDLLAPAMAGLILLLTFIAGAMAYDGFGTARTLLGLPYDNAWLGIAAAGAFFVILSGGIDLSAGSMIAFSSVLIAVLIERMNVSPMLSLPIVLLVGLLFGAAMGGLIHSFALPAFMVTLAGLFFLRASAFALSEWTNPEHVAQSIQINHELMREWSMSGLGLGRAAGTLSAQAMAMLAVFAVLLVVSHRTSFGRNVHAIGGDQHAATLMGVPVGRTKVQVYALAGLCSAAAGVAATLYKSSGDPAGFIGAELDIITAVVIGGTLLRGGTGYLAGAFCGVMIIGLIQTLINFDGRLAGAWPRIIMGGLLLGAILLQRLLGRLAGARG